MITKTEWTPLQKEWFGCKYAAMQPVDAVRARCSDAANRINVLEDALEHIRDNAMTSTKEATVRIAESALANGAYQPRPSNSSKLSP